MRYTDEQRAFIRENYADMTNAELAEAYNDRFGEGSIGQNSLRVFASHEGLRKSKEAFSRRSRKYTDEQLEWLREFIPGHSWDEISSSFEETFGKSLGKAAIKNLKVRLRVNSGTKGGFRIGHVPHNKGKTWDELGYSEETKRKMLATTFKEGEVSGAAKECVRELLDTREYDGYIQIKVSPRDRRDSKDDWISYAKFVWMQRNGRDWPEGHRPVFIDRDNRNFDPDNIAPVPEDAYMIVATGSGGIEWHDRETLETAIIHARLVRKRFELERTAPRRCVKCGRVFVPEDSLTHCGQWVKRCPDCRVRKS